MFKLFTTNHQSNYWKNRKIDWKREYLDTFKHPHRLWMLEKLVNLRFSSVFEVGCGPGANLLGIGLTFPHVALGGCDVNEEAILLAQKTFPKGSLFEVAPGDNLLMSDKSCDLALSDMCLIYVGGRRIKRYLQEMTRISRSYVVLSEFYHPSWWMRLKMTLAGRHTHNYPRLLKNLGCVDIQIMKMPESLWPGAKDTNYRYLITARI
jgi:ubiquinone/menaquinone biosynthesis C-methylase UbiE